MTLTFKRIVKKPESKMEKPIIIWLQDFLIIHRLSSQRPVLHGHYLSKTSSRDGRPLLEGKFTIKMYNMTLC